MRLIDADKLKADVVSWENCYNGFSDTYDKAMIIDTIDEQPTIDAVPVVRCGECEYWTGYCTNKIWQLRRRLDMLEGKTNPVNEALNTKG